jgi:hypothetical protein
MRYFTVLFILSRNTAKKITKRKHLFIEATTSSRSLAGAPVRSTLGTSSGRAPTRRTFSLCRSHLRLTTIARFAQERERRAPDHERRRIRPRMAGPSAPTALHSETSAFAADLLRPRHRFLPRSLQHRPPLLHCKPRGARLRRYLQPQRMLGSDVPSERVIGTGPSRLSRCSSWIPLRRQCRRLQSSAQEEGTMTMQDPTSPSQPSAYL